MNNNSSELIYALDSVPPSKESFFAALQHVLASFVGIITPPPNNWWGAWLNQNMDKTVIAPKKWFNDITKDTSDLIPNTWVRL